MVETGTMGERVLDALVKTGALTPDHLATIDEAWTAGISPGRLLLERGAITPDDVAVALEQELGVPRVDLSSYAPDDEALLLVSAETARARSVLPLFEIDGMLTVAIGDPADVFELGELAVELGMEVEAVLVEPASLHQALITHFGPADDEELIPPPPSAEWAATPPGPEVASPAVAPGPPGLSGESLSGTRHAIEQMVEGAPARDTGKIDLDVLAVADAGKVSVLVSDILEHALHQGASAIHLLPYKDDFFLVYRIEGRLERIASAPLSLQCALVDGFKAYVRVGAVPATAPALGRVRARIAEREVVLTLSAVPTVAGQRLVISLVTDPGAPHDLAALGMPEAECRALHAMVERGRGILLVCGPVAGGRSATYYALLAHAAAVGKTVYSVERSVEHEIPAIAQVLVNPGSSVGAASYLAVGMRQDTDVIAIDSLQAVEDVHRAIEAAGLGKLVIATFSGAGIVAGVRRMLDLGAEPTSLASALTFGVGQRLVRTNCPDCSQEERNPIVTQIPGAAPGVVSLAGTGCSSCGGSGFAGITGVFEVLPFSESVRAAIAVSADAGDIAASAQAAGMRPIISSGLAKLEQGLVSAEELNRVLRFAE
ncbi:MAG: Flp pilus assembly complex ATPase component TadA [Coriobacteriia bacterium]|nr:Flp pilus assembly complex ATPase component TadA [Coriobacteriia bacterium]